MHTIDHIGILVPDLEAAIARWGVVLQCDFSPIGRYRSAHYVDSADGIPHLHDARFSVSRSRAPYIELLEAVGEGSHAPSRLGVHHFAIRVPRADVEAERQGLGLIAHSREPDGRMHICFTDPAALDGVSLEFVSDFPGPILSDDGSPAWRDPGTGQASLWGPA
ncbi:VOC family protein [Microbacterium invictum]|uniref:VOC family protein n=1 Tax=Microbacterium invictum TaxID=515415 RepID=UPI002005246D|nr:VOC family protein [Microbacterium invictum]